jgi:ribosome-associated protein
MPKPLRKRRPRRPPPTAPGNADQESAAQSSAPHAAHKPARPKRKKTRLPLATVVTTALDDLKGEQISLLDVRHLTSVTDTMIVVSGRSDRHVRSLANTVVEKCKAAGYRPLGVEGQASGEWVLVDLGDVVVHVMLPRAREFYNLEKLWDLSDRDREEAADVGA